MSSTSFSRDPLTGLISGIEYPRLPNGRIDWKHLIPTQHIVFNVKNEKLAAEIEKAYGAPAKSLVYADVAAKQPVDDRHILILLAGFQEVAELRGYRAARIPHLPLGQGIVGCACEIDWIPNEEEPLGKTSFGTADATFENTGGFGYLTAMAGNRAFVRAVKNGLGIRVLGFDEIATKDTPLPESGTSSGSATPISQIGQPVPTLIRACEESHITFDQLRKGAQTKYRSKIESDPDTWKAFEDVPPRDCLTLITLVKEGRKAAKAA